MIHIGSIIKEVFENHPRRHTIVWLARQLNCVRGNVYDILSRASIDTLLLLRLSKILDHDFFADISELLKNGEDQHGQ